MDTGNSKGRVRSDINVTPLVDIVLVLLIIFIVITPAVHDSVRLPVAKHAEQKRSEKPLTLILSARGGVAEAITIEEPDAQSQSFLLKEIATRQRVIRSLQKYLVIHQGGAIFIKADAGLSFKDVNLLFQLCKEGGASEISLVTGEESKDSNQGGRS
jgi:biopolymer transport protein TolR